MLQQKTTFLLPDFNKTYYLAHILQRRIFAPINLKTLPNSHESSNMTEK